MPLPPSAPFQVSRAGLAARVTLRPFRDGAANIDSLLAELDPRKTKLVDAVLDLRTLCTTTKDAGAWVEQLMRVRQLLDGCCSLGLYRVRCWARAALQIEVRRDRAAPWVPCEFPLDATRMDEVVNTALAEVARDGWIPATAQVRFMFMR